MQNEVIGKYVIARSSPSGVWAGIVKSVDGNTVVMTSARRLWRWWAAEGVSLSGIATKGLHPKKLKECKIEPAVETCIVFEVCELIPASEIARRSIESMGVPAP